MVFETRIRIMYPICVDVGYWMRSIIAGWRERVTANVKVATLLGSLPASSNTEDGR